MSPTSTAKGGRKAQKARTRAALLQAGRQVFSEKGYAATSIADIASRAGVATGTVYVHFDGKEALVDELLVGFNAELAARLEPLLADVERPLPALVRRVAETFLDHWEANRDFVRTYAERSSAGVPMEGMRDGVNPPVAAVLRRALAAAVAPGPVSAADPDLLAHALLAMWLRVGLQYLFNDEVTREVALATLARATVGAVRGVLAEEENDHG